MVKYGASRKSASTGLWMNSETGVRILSIRTAPPVAPRGNDSPEQIGSAAPVSPPDWTALSITEPIHLLFAGRMVALKGGKVLLDSLPHVVRRLARPLVLNLAGDGPARSEWERRARAI